MRDGALKVVAFFDDVKRKVVKIQTLDYSANSYSNFEPIYCF